MKLQKKSVSKIALTDLLRRKKTNLTKYLTDNGIFSYELLATRCSSIGVVPPTEEQFTKARGSAGLHEVSSPTEGIVVLNPDILEEEEEEENNSSIIFSNDTGLENMPKGKKKRKFSHNI